MNDNMEKYLSAKAQSKSKVQELLASIDQVENTFEEAWKKVEKGHGDLQAKKDDLAKRNGGSDVSDDDILHINAGGEVIPVPRRTLTQIKGSRLEALFSGRWEKQLGRDSKGRIFLDVNPTCFRCIVDYLNAREIAPPDKLPSLPQTDSENQVYLDALLTAFGLYDPRQVDSIILMDPKHIRAITGFLQEDNLDSGLTLLYRGTRDGMNAATFHQKCDHQGPTITVVKSTENYIFGGFADKDWKSNGGWTPSDKAFLFGLFCHGGQEPVKIRTGTHKTNATYCSSRCGPTFGSGHDLITLYEGSNSKSNIGGTYLVPPGGNRHYFTGGQNYNISEMEVFKVENFQSQPPPASSLVQNQPWYQLSFDAFPDDIKRSFWAQKDSLVDASNELQLLQANFEKEQALVDAFCSEGGNDVVTLNVSGRIMAVKHSTLAIYPDSVLYKQFVDVNWNGRENRKRKRIASARDWSKEEVFAWSKKIDGLSEDVSCKFEDVTGAELLVMGREDIKDLGIKRPGTVALIVDAIQRLRAETDENSSVVIHHSDYCFGKILDHMRLKAMKHLGVPDPKLPQIREGDKKNFEVIVEYFFPNEETARQFLS